MNIGKIAGTNFPQGYKKISGAQETKGVSKKDGVILSDSGRIFSDALQKAKSLPEIRENRVSQVSNSIKSGNYSVDSQDIAKKLIDGAV